MNQGTLVVFNLDPSISNAELTKIFSKYGEVKEIRETPNKKHHKFIEFYDTRDADKAMKALNKMEIKVIYSFLIILIKIRERKLKLNLHVQEVHEDNLCINGKALNLH